MRWSSTVSGLSAAIAAAILLAAPGAAVSQTSEAASAAPAAKAPPDLNQRLAASIARELASDGGLSDADAATRLVAAIQAEIVSEGLSPKAALAAVEAIDPGQFSRSAPVAQARWKVVAQMTAMSIRMTAMSTQAFGSAGPRSAGGVYAGRPGQVFGAAPPAQRGAKLALQGGVNPFGASRSFGATLPTPTGPKVAPHAGSSRSPASVAEASPEPAPRPVVQNRPPPPASTPPGPAPASSAPAAGGTAPATPDLNVTYNDPKTLPLYRQVPFTLIIQSAHAVQAGDFNGAPGQRVTRSIPHVSLVKAVLSGPPGKVAIDSSQSPPCQRVTDTDNPRWDWLVQSKSPGKALLQIDLWEVSDCSAANPAVTLHHVQTFDIPVSASLWSTLEYWVASTYPVLLTALGLIGSAGTAFGAWKWLRRKDPTPKKPARGAAG